MPEAMAQFDYIVIGAGSAGCALAAGLSEDSTKRVLVLEAGPEDRSLWIHVPIGFFKTLTNPKYNWGYQADYNAEPGSRQVPWPRAKVIGGSSSMNGLVYIRGQRQDYDEWQQLSANGWDWQGVEPYFSKAEQGPVGVSEPRFTHPLCDAFIDAAAALGVPKNANFNGVSQAGAGYYHLNTKNGFRTSSAVSYLKPARKRPNLEVLTDCLVERVHIENGRAQGVYFRRNGKQQYVAANAEVILSAGAIGSPQILQLSGVGPKQVLQNAGVEVQVESPAVGRNLQDHFAARIIAKVKHSRTLNEMSHSWLSQLGMGLEYLFKRRGPLTLGAGMAGLFTALMDTSGRPDMQYLMGPLSTDNPAEGLHTFPGFTLTATQLRPKSRGWLEIKSQDPTEHPKIVANYLDDELDQKLIVEGLKFARKLLASEPLAHFVDAEYLPGSEIASDESLLAFARENGGSIYHPSGSCVMGDNDNSVVDSRLRVRGVAGLRVADASVMPFVLSGNINAACMMIGSKASDLIKSET